MRKRFCGLCWLSASILATTSLGQVVPAERLTDWQPGLPGGIPTVLGPIENVIDHGADPTGIADSAPALVAAMGALPASGGVVYLPDGVYRLASKIAVDRDDVVFRGAGPYRTRILSDHTDRVFEVLRYFQGPWQDVTNGFFKGSTSLDIANISGFQVGRFVEIQQDNDPDVMYTQPEWNTVWGQEAIGQICEITRVSGNTVTMRRPLHFSFRADLNPQARYLVLRRGVGFEDLSVEQIQSGRETFYFKLAAYCWVRNVESYHTTVIHIDNTFTVGCTYRDSHLHHAWDYSGGKGIGVNLGKHVTDILVENNVLHHLRHSMMASKGACGNVFGYNFSFDGVQGTGQTNLNSGYVLTDVSLHGHQGQFNLFEGNLVEEITVADYWGPMGPGNTFLRNRVMDRGVTVQDSSHDQNLLGNVIPSETLVIDGSVTGTLHHGNWFDGDVHWDPGIPDHSIPVSYYLTNKPSFFGEMDWPSLGGDMPHSTNLPSVYRYACDTVLNDFDSDGMPDPWECAYLGGPSALPDPDPDGDRCGNRMEFIAGTDPSNRLSVLELNIDQDGPQILIRFPCLLAEGEGYEGLYRTYDLESSSELNSPSWQGIPGCVGLVGDDQVFCYSNTPGQTSDFFRARVHLNRMPWLVIPPP